MSQYDNLHEQVIYYLYAISSYYYVIRYISCVLRYDKCVFRTIVLSLYYDIL